MRAVIQIIDRISRWGGYFSAVCILLMTLLILVETVVRMVAGSSIFIAEEYSAYLMANFVMLGLAYTLRENGHIKVNLLLSRLRQRAKGAFRLAACLLGLAVFVLLTYQLFLLAVDNFQSGRQSMNITKTPIYIPQAGLVIGSALMALQLLAEGLREGLALWGGGQPAAGPEQG